MKALLYSVCLFLILIAVGCDSKEDQIIPTQVVGRWKLTTVIHTSMIAGQPDLVTAPPYEEILEFSADNTFSRSRSTGYEATGRYSSEKVSTDEYGILATFTDKFLSFHELSNRRVYSYTEGQVYFRQPNSEQLVESYRATDGPSFYYEKIKDENL